MSRGCHARIAVPAAAEDLAMSGVPKNETPETRKIMLWGILLAGVLLVGGMAFSLLPVKKPPNQTLAS